MVRADLISNSTQQAALSSPDLFPFVTGGGRGQFDTTALAGNTTTEQLPPCSTKVSSLPAADSS